MGEGLGSFEYHFEQHVSPTTWTFLRLSNRMQQLAVATKASSTWSDG